MASRAAHPTKDIQQMATTVDRLFHTAFHAPRARYQRESLFGWRPLRARDLRAPLPQAAHASIQNTASRPPVPGINIRETAQRYIIEVELPRIKADSLYIEITGDLLIIRGERDITAPANRLNRDMTSGGAMVHRYIQLPMAARPGEVHAHLEGNTVKVNIQKRPGSA